MNIQSTIFAAASLLCLAACGKEGTEIPACDNEITVIPTLDDTRATLIPAGDLTDQRIHIDGYLHDTETRYLNSNILYDQGAWVFYTDRVKGVHYYWPQNSTLDILAYSPAKLENTFVSILSSKTIKCTGLPLADSLQEGTKLKEFICGYRYNCPKTGGAIAMPLQRPFATVNFYLDEAVRSTLNYITIKGLYSTGIYDVKAGTWSDLETQDDLYCKVGKQYPDSINNASHLGGPYLVIPQSLRVGAADEVKLVFSYKSAGNAGNTITETALGQAKNSTDSKVSAWEPGKVYNYWVSLNGAANEIRMKVTIGNWSIQGNEEIDVK